MKVKVAIRFLKLALNVLSAFLDKLLIVPPEENVAIARAWFIKDEYSSPLVPIKQFPSKSIETMNYVSEKLALIEIGFSVHFATLQRSCIVIEASIFNFFEQICFLNLHN